MPTLNAVDRARELLALGPCAVEELGRGTGDDAADALRLLDGISASATSLHAINTALVPLISKFRSVTGLQRAWQWFSGESLEREIFFGETQEKIEQLAQDGVSGDLAVGGQIEILRGQTVAMAQQVQRLDIEIAAGRLLLSPDETQKAARAGIDDHDRARLSRRLGNLESMVTALQLTQAQYTVALEHAQSVSDRFHEIHALLLPIWKQRMGFDLFARRVTQNSE